MGKMKKFGYDFNNRPHNNFQNVGLSSNDNSYGGSMGGFQQQGGFVNQQGGFIQQPQTSFGMSVNMGGVGGSINLSGGNQINLSGNMGMGQNMGNMGGNLYLKI